ncbi:MAG: hypothetical protein LBH98_04580 [Chitinispirillales bacterium]|nr:hypothetical protein [Chitinispirillales bacterium]
MEVNSLTLFDEELVKRVDIYRKHPHLLPFIGENYGKGNCNKILLVGESFRLANRENKSELNNMFEKWYEKSNDDLKLSDEEIGWTKTRETITYSNSTFNRNVRSILEELGETVSSVAFMNFFQRPAYPVPLGRKTGIVSNEKDVEVAKEALQKVCEIIKPNYLLFVSKKSFWSFGDKCEILQGKEIGVKKIGAVAHPACRYWNKDGGKYGRQAFINFFQEFVKKNKEN